MTDKAVSTEDLCAPRNPSLEAARLEAVIKALIENKVETFKNARKSSSITSSPKSLFNKLRGNSTSTVSSKDKDEIASIHSQYIQEERTAEKPDQRRRRPPHPSPRRRRGKPHLERTLQFNDEDENLGFLHKDHPFAQMDCAESCYCHQNPNEIQIHVDEDFISLNLEEYNNLDPEDVAGVRTVKKAQKKKRRRRKHRRHLKMTAVAVQVDDFKELDEDELSKRARITIVLTAFLLLFMCLLLVGITLRMAPLIDDMVHPHAPSKMSDPLDFPEIDCLIDDVPPILPKSSSLSDISSWARASPKPPHRLSCQFGLLEAPPRRASTRRSSSRRHRTSSLAASRKWLLEQKSRERKRRRTVCVVIGTFLFILFACVLVVIVTLTHQTELGKRNSTAFYYTFAPPPEVALKGSTTSKTTLEGNGVRKENEELMNSLVEDSTSHDSLQNLTASVPDTLK